MNRKILLAVLALIILTTVTAVTAAALFTDEETSGTNTFTAGTLDLAVDGTDDAVEFQSFSISNIGVDGVVTGGNTWEVSNSGSVPGYLSMSITGLTNTENGCNEPELKTEPACEADNNGELGAAITTTVLVDRDGAGATFSDETAVSSTLATANQGAYATQWDAYAASLTDGYIEIGAGESIDVTLNWATDPATYDNSIQSDGVTFTVQFDLTQITPS